MKNDVLVLQRRERTDAKVAKLRSLGHTEVVRKKCEFENPQIKERTTHSPLLCTTPLNPRDAFYGVRTNVNRFHHKGGLGGLLLMSINIVSVLKANTKLFLIPNVHE